MKCLTKLGLLGVVVLAVNVQAYGQETASGILNLEAIQGTSPNQTYTYDITVTNTSQTNIGTFWYAWLPPDNYYDLLPDPPLSENSPTGWIASIQGQNNGDDGNSIQWYSGTNPLTPGSSLTFGFTTDDSPDQVTGFTRFGFPIGYSYVYSGLPEGDGGSLFTVQTGSLTPPVPEPATFSLLAATGAAICVHRRRRP